MNPENQDFENLRRLLKLKRYEQPPPRYFSEFSGRVINRLRLDLPQRGSDSALEIPWLQRLLSVLDAKPLLAGAFGAVVVGVLVGGAIYSDQAGIPEASSNLAVSQMPLPAAVVAAPIPLTASIGNGGAFALSGSGSTNGRSLFDAIGTPSGVQLINFTPSTQ